MMHTNQRMPQRKTRRGMSLIIMATTIAVGAILSGIAVLALSRMMGLNGAAREHLGSTVVVAQLAERFRSDVAAARSVEVANVTTDNSNDTAAVASKLDQPESDEVVNAAELLNSHAQRLTLRLEPDHTITYKAGMIRSPDVSDADTTNGDTTDADPSDAGVRLQPRLERVEEKAGKRVRSETYSLPDLQASFVLTGEASNKSSPQFARVRLNRRSEVASHLARPARAVVIEALVGRDQRFERPDSPEAKP